jgi:hypothetical protein
MMQEFKLSLPSAVDPEWREREREKLNSYDRPLLKNGQIGYTMGKIGMY